MSQVTPLEAPLETETADREGERPLPAPPPATQRAGRSPAPLDVDRLRRDFPGLSQLMNGRPLAYLDSAATSQKPRAVLAATERYYREDCSNVHRGVYGLAARATAAYEAVRGTARRFLGAACDDEIVFTRGTTEAMNLVARCFARPRLLARRHGDAVLVTHMEHHSNIVPWQLLTEEVGGRLLVAPIDDRGELILEEFERLLGEGVAIAAFPHVSNALGTVNPVATMVALARSRGVPVAIDGAQAAPHLPIDIGPLGSDFYAFSGHKVFGPTGIGVLWGRGELLAAMPPYEGGGDMIRSVSFAKTTYADPPVRFEAGTPNVAGAIGLGAALSYVLEVGREAIAAHEQELLAHATEALLAIPGLRLIGTAREKACVLSFVMEGVHPHDIGTILDHAGVAVRAGHHCAQPVMDRFGVPATARASFALYNTHEEVERLAAALLQVREMFS